MLKRTLRELPRVELEGQRALVRVDFNVPLDPEGQVADTTRIEAALPTLRHLLEHGARPVLLSHLGRPKGEPDPRYSLAPVSEALGTILGSQVEFTADCASADAVAASRELADGRVLLAENTRFHDGEKANDESFARQLAELGDLYVNDAFGSMHRAHASTCGVARWLRPTVAGFLVEKELSALGILRTAAESPFVVCFGGAKIADKIELVDLFLARADTLLVGGAMANTFLRAQGHEMGRSLVEEEALDVARRTLERGQDRIRLPSDLVVTSAPGELRSDVELVEAETVAPDMAAVDIGPATREAYAARVREARTLFWNGPMGLFEDPRFADGTFAVARAAAQATVTGAFTVIGGGDSASAIRKAGLAEAVSHVSTGGGAALEYLAAGTLPGVEALDDA